MRAMLDDDAGIIRASGAVAVDQQRLNDVLGDPARVAAVERSGLLDSLPDEAYDRLTQITCRLLRAPVSTMSVVTAERQRVKSQSRLAGHPEVARELPVAHSFCQYVVAAGEPIVARNVREHPVLRSNPAIAELGVTAYAGVPLLDPDGHRLGALCVMSPVPRDWTDDDLAQLTELAELLTTEMRLRDALRVADGQARALERSEWQARRAAAALERNARALEEAQTLARVGSWEFDPATRRLTLSAELRHLLGLDHNPSTLAAFAAAVPADQRADFCERVRRGLEPDGRWQAEHSIVRPDGETRLMLSRGVARIGPDGSLELLRGTLQDVTDERDQEARFLAAFWGAPIGAALVGLVGAQRGRWLKVNRELERLLGSPPGELDGGAVDSGVHPDDLDRTIHELDRLVRGEVERSQHEHRLRRADGGWVWVLATHSLVHPAGGEPAYAMGHYVDIADRKRYEQELEHLAHHDGLTGVFNRRRFEEELDRALSRAARSAAAGALLLVDLDHFKAINDDAGHAAGDELLVRIAHAVAATLRAGDTFGRIGGDEFAILLPEGDLAQAKRVAERVLRTVSRTAAARDGRLFATASVGIAPWGGQAPPEPSQLLIEADTAMYEAKGFGGDRYAVYAEPDDDDSLDSGI